MESKSEMLPLKRSVSYNIEGPENSIYIVSGLPIKLSQVEKSIDLLEINKKLPRARLQDYKMFFLKEHYSNSRSFRRQITKKCISTSHFPIRQLNFDEICNLYDNLYSAASILHEKALKTIEISELVNRDTLILDGTVENKTLFLNLKQLAQQIIGDMYLNLENAFNLLEKSRENLSEHIEDDIRASASLVMFYILWFYCVKLNRKNICKFSYFILDFTPEVLKILFGNRFERLDKVTRSIILDLAIQITLSPEDFHSPEKISSFFVAFIVVNFNNSIHPTSTIEKISHILGSTLLVNYFCSIGFKDYLIALNKIKRMIYIAKLPSGVLGLTLFNGYIIVSRERIDEIENQELKLGFFLLCTIHEIAHFMTRHQLENDKQWIECLTPRERNEEAGFHLESNIFGKSVMHLNLKACSFLLNPESWEIGENQFRISFQDRNKTTKEEEKKENDCNKIVRFRMGSFNNVFFGYCPKQNRNKKKIEEIKD